MVSLLMSTLIMSHHSRLTSQELPFSFEDLKGWYNGYYTFDDPRLYNPWSVANDLTEGDLSSYWTSQVTNPLVSFHRNSPIIFPGYNYTIQKCTYYMLEQND